MKFDADRALALAEEWAGPRLYGTESEWRAADAVAAQLEGAGLRVVRVERPGLPRRSAGLAIVILTQYFNFIVTRNTGRSLLVDGLVCLIVVATFLAWWWFNREAPKASRGRNTALIIGKIEGDDPAPRRLVIWTRLDTPRVFRLEFAGLIALVALFPEIHSGYCRALGIGPFPDFILILLQWALVPVVLLDVLKRSSRPVRGDNRTGLALLVELARSWPRRMADRVEISFMAAPSFDGWPGVGADPIGRTRPTLAIRLDAPGVGPSLTVEADRNVYPIAEASARDLWLPHRARRVVPGFRPFRTSLVRVRGRHDDSPIEPAVLAAAAQLVNEIALRWVKSADQRASAARSSQKPG